MASMTSSPLREPVRSSMKTSQITTIATETLQEPWARGTQHIPGAEGKTEHNCEGQIVRVGQGHTGDGEAGGVSRLKQSHENDGCGRPCHGGHHPPGAGQAAAGAVAEQPRWHHPGDQGQNKKTGLAREPVEPPAREQPVGKQDEASDGKEPHRQKFDRTAVIEYDEDALQQPRRQCGRLGRKRDGRGRAWSPGSSPSRRTPRLGWRDCR
jgi:hypothetical protein